MTRLTLPPVTEGFIPFRHPSFPPGFEAKTWFRVVGDIKGSKDSGGKRLRPLVALHGGPGASHDYLRPTFDRLAAETGRPVVYYDQFGGGRSTHFREKRLDTGFWTIDLFMDELDNVLKALGILGDDTNEGVGFDLLGHSWGGMLAAPYAVRRHPTELKSLLLCGSPCRMDHWERAIRNLLEGLPEDVRKAIEKGEKEGDYDNEEYQHAVMEFYKRHMCRLWPWPKEVETSLGWLEKDDTVYFTMQGPSEVTVIGSLKKYNMSEECKKIDVPVLLINGENDEAQDITIKPWFRGIPKVKWYTIPGGSHMAHLEYPKKYIELVDSFLSDT